MEVIVIFEEELIIMNRTTQPAPGGGITVTWSEGAKITAKMQISNMPETLIAQAQGVVATGYLVVDTSLEKYLTLNTYLKYPKGKYYVRITDIGIVEAGERFFNDRQFAIEQVQRLPQ